MLVDICAQGGQYGIVESLNLSISLVVVGCGKCVVDVQYATDVNDKIGGELISVIG